LCEVDHKGVTMRIADILRSKGSAVATVTETTTVSGLLTELVVHNIGAMVVVGPDGVLGMVSERDVVRKLHEHGPELLRHEVKDIMSSIVVSCTPDDHIDDLSALMTNNRVRHVPVLHDGRLVGIVSIGDVVKNRMEELQAEHEQLQAYITQGG
jgi:CBS domain-containing protein